MVIKETSRSHHLLPCFEEFEAVEELNNIKYSQAAGMVSSSSTSDLPSYSSSHYNPHTTATRSSKKQVHFTDKDNEIIRYQVTKEDIQNSWLNIDVSSALEMARNENQDKIVSFGPTATSTTGQHSTTTTASSGGNVIVDMCKNGKEYVVLIQQHRLVKEILGQRTNLRRYVLEEQARQKKLDEEVVVGGDKEEGLCAVACKHSKWGVEIAKSSRWLHRSISI